VSVKPIVPPHSDEAEQAVLGSLLMDNRALDELADLEPRHFYQTAYQAAFRAIQHLVAASRVADVVTLHEAGGGDVVALNELVMSVPSAANVAHYARIVHDRWVERELLRCATEQAEDAQAMGDPAEKLDRAQGRLAKIAIQRTGQESVPIADALVSFLDRLEQEAAGDTQVISTGLHDLDELMGGGGRRGELHVYGGRPKMGKTAFTLQIMRNIALNHGVLFCSQEMPVNELMGRHAAAMGNINIAKLRKPSLLTNDDWSAISESVELLRPMRLTQDAQRGLTLLDVRRKVMECKRKHGCDVVVVDYLQLMNGGGDNRNQELDRISNGLKAMAGDLDVWVVLLSQMSREADKRHGPPVMTDLRDSGAIEAAADVIGLLYREIAHPLTPEKDNKAWKHYAQLEVIQRNGAPGTVSLWFSGEYQQFKNWSGPPPFKTQMGRGGSRARSTGMEA
jgi:replicative DNA helicase